MKGMIKTSSISLLALAMTASLAASANSDGQNQFSEIDKMINSIEFGAQKSHPEDPVVESFTIEKPKRLNDVTTISNPKKEFVTMRQIPKALEVEKPTPQPQEKIKTTVESNLSSLLSELPPHTRFEFQRNVFIPSYKSGVIFSAGKVAGSIDSGIDPEAYLVNEISSDTKCILTSSKNYIMMRGGDVGENKKATYLEVSKVEFLEGSKSNGEPVILSSVFFEKKMPKDQNVKSDGISLRLSCQVPKSLYSDLKSYNLGDVNKAVGGLFNFELPKFIEI